MVENKYKWNNRKKQIEEVEPYLYPACGSDYAMIISDLKTIRDVLKRISNWHIRKNVKAINIYSSNNILNEDDEKLVLSITNLENFKRIAF
jgi:hypothetical protein